MTLKRGDYALCNFPFRESPGPGTSPHIVIVSATGRVRQQAVAIVFYTTTRLAFAGTKRPRQFLLVEQGKAMSLGQRTAFHVDASRVALLPITAAYFPELRDGIVPVHGRDIPFVEVVERRLEELMAAGHRVDRIRIEPDP